MIHSKITKLKEWSVKDNACEESDNIQQYLFQAIFG